MSNLMFDSIRRLAILVAAVFALLPTANVLAQGCPGSPQQSRGPDVIVGILGHDSVTNYSSATVNGVVYEAFSMGTTSCNLGSAQLSWIDENNNPNHPVIAQNCFRLKNVNGSRRFEQLGQAWLKHGFFALSGSACCPPSCADQTNGDWLGIGCSDPYASSRNGGQSGSGPKWQVNPTTGVHPEPKANPPGATTTSVSRRLQVRVSDLEVSNGSGDVNATRYFGEGQYVTADDADYNNENNNASYRLLAVSGSGNAWTFNTIGTTQQMQPGIRAWKDTDTTATIPGVITEVVESDVLTPEDGGRDSLVIVASQATHLGGGVWHFEYAAQNLNSDRAIRSFSIPASQYLTLTNIGFRDVEYHSNDGYGSTNAGNAKNYDGADWPATLAAGAITWTMPAAAIPENSNALRWGTLYNFRFDANIAPAASNGTATMEQYKAPGTFVVGTAVVPSPVSCVKGDMDENGIVDAADIRLFAQFLLSGGGTPQQKCAGDCQAIPSGSIDMADVDPFADCVLASGC